MGNIKCIKYKELEDVVRAYQEKNLFQDGIIITASRNICRFLQEELEPVNDVVRSINDILDEILPGWPNQNVFFEYLLLREIIDEEKQHLDSNEYSFLKNSNRDILMAIKTACEMGISPQMINTQDANERNFIKIYEKFCQRSPSIREAVASMDSWDKADILIELLNNINLDIKNIKTIYLQGFFYMKPLQQRFIEALCKLPVQICFLNNYDDDYQKAYEVWDILYGEQNKEATYIPYEEGREYCFNEIFDDESKSVQKYSKPKASITEFNDVFSFVRYIGKFKKDDISVLCPKEKDIRDIFDIFFPDKEDKKHFLAYPVGQYILALHSMWDMETDSVKCTPEKLRKCLASGWANRDTRDSEKYLTYFERVQDYFYDCRSVDEWKERMKNLVRVYDEVLPLFKNESSDSRWIRVLSNPLLDVGAFSLTKEILLELDKVLQDIFASVELLFNEKNKNKKKDVNIHFQQLKRIVEDRKGQHAKEEKEVISNIITRLGMVPKERLSCSIENLVDAMQLFLGGENKDEDDKSSDTHIYALREIEYVSCQPRRNVLVCFCDDNNVPAKKDKEIWPFTEELLLNMKFTNDVIKQRILFYLKNIEAKRASSRYLMFRIMQIRGVHLSWISEYQNKLRSPSIYISLLTNPDFYGLELEHYNENLLNGKGMYKGDQSKINVFNYRVTDVKANAVSELGECDRICPYKKIYAYGLAEHPEFDSKFHLGFFATYLLILLTKANNNSSKRIEVEDYANEVFKILPMFNASEQMEIISFARRKYSRTDAEDYDIVEDSRYINNRLYLKFLEMYKHDYDYETHDKKKCVYCFQGESCYFREWIEGV